MKAHLLYGEKTADVNLPESVELLEMKPLQPVDDPFRAVEEALDHPIESPPLTELAKGKKNACIVISDITRPVPNKIILPPLLKTLEQSGIPRDNITILIATGMHRPNLGSELEYMVGRDIMDHYQIVNHYCRKSEEYRKIDEIEGAPIEINNRYLDADLKILTGLIEPHFYAGYSGGRKAILPGISSFKTMKFMHSYEMIDHPNVTNCLLEGNPFHEYGIRVAELMGVDFILNVVINKEREIAGVFAGHYDKAHVAGCRLVREHSVVELKERVDLVITSGGGFPLDATFYQISKALICAMDILEKGGTIVVACECREGLGSAEFCGILESVCSFQEFSKKYGDPGDFVIDQWCVQNIYQALDHAGEVYVYSSGLTGDEVKNIGAAKVDDLQATVDRLLKERHRAVVVPEGPYVVGMVRDKTRERRF
ncbi:MAG: nickel-dependent lactate racemase [Deltaproteobacteria bacterium]|nr:nickel-dependent lactate racemase [Deltaproteobacteria bacterium]